MNKINDLAFIAYNTHGLPKEIEVKGTEIHIELVLTETILLPVLVMIANSLYFKMSGQPLIPIKGHIKKRNLSPFGVALDGDLDMGRLCQPIGLITMGISNAIELLSDMLVNDGLEPFANHWVDDVLADIDDGTPIAFETYTRLPLLQKIEFKKLESSKKYSKKVG